MVDVIDDETTLRQTVFDEHDDAVGTLSIRIQRLITSCVSASSFSTNQVVLKRLTKMKKSLSSIDETVTGLRSDSDNTCLVHQYQEQMSYLKKEMSDVNTRLLSLMFEYDDELLVCRDEAEKSMFDCSLKVKKALHSQHSTVLFPP